MRRDCAQAKKNGHHKQKDLIEAFEEGVSGVWGAKMLATRRWLVMPYARVRDVVGHACPGSLESGSAADHVDVRVATNTKALEILRACQNSKVAFTRPIH